MYASQLWGISGSYACKDCVWLIILDAGLHKTCTGERVLVVMTRQVQCNIPTFEALLRKNMYLFLARCRSDNVWLPALTQSDCLNSSLFLNTTTAFYFVTECWDTAVFEGVHCARHNAFVLYLALTSLGSSVPLCSSVVPSEQSVKICPPPPKWITGCAPDQTRPATTVVRALVRVKQFSGKSSPRHLMSISYRCKKNAPQYLQMWSFF